VLKIEIGFHLRLKKGQNYKECASKFNFGSIWVLAQLEENATVNLGISHYGMNLHQVSKRLQAETPIRGVQLSRSFLENWEEIM